MIKSVLPSVTTQTFPMTCTTIHKLHPLATHFW